MLRPHPHARLIPIGGGKGGVGKTLLTANLAASLAGAGLRVVAVDGDLEGANLHTALGVRRPVHSMAEYVARREEDIPKLIEDTPYANLRLISGVGGDLGEAQPSHSRRLGFVRALRRLDADVVLLDLGAGTHASVLDYFMVCDDGLVVIAPEPTSVENAYSFMRAAFYRRLQLAMVTPDVRRLVTLAMDQRNERGIKTPFDLLREVERNDAQAGGRLLATMRSFRPRIVVNDVRSTDDIKLGFSVRSICRKYYAIEAEYIGYVSHDEAARDAVRACEPVVVANPKASSAIYIQRIAKKIMELPPAE
ncbi:MAG: P-loop NTPase [Myxococcales bacterium]|nr:P-loop NTPase [Myxococcales bacterium]